LIRESFPSKDYNLYPFHFTDGDNFSDDDEHALKLLTAMIPQANIFCYGQVETTYGSGPFLKWIQEKVNGNEKVRTATIRNRESIYDALKIFLGSGH